MKKKLIIFPLVFFCSIAAYAVKLTIEIRGIEKIAGSLYVGIYNSPKTFLKKPVTGFKVDVEDKKMELVCDEIKPGEYAISLYQDENGNEKLDKGLFGIPSEKYGFSNDAAGFAGSPSYKQCKFIFKGDKKLVINLR